MFDALRRTLGLISVTQDQKGIIHVNGCPANFLRDDILKRWKTSRLVNYMFTSVTKHSFSFPAFFAVEIDYILRTLLDAEQTTRRYTSRGAITAIRDGLREKTWLKSVTTVTPDILNFNRISRLLFTPKEPQRRFLDVYNAAVPRLNLRGYLLHGDPGTGKTYTSMVLSECLEADTVFVICPKNAIDKPWRKDILEQYRNKTQPWIAADGKPWDRNTRFFVAHYESIARLFDILHAVKPKNLTIIVDENHNLNEITAQRTKLACDLVRHAERVCQTLNVLPMSGTPLKAMGSEVVPLMRMIDPLFTPEVEARFIKIFGTSKGYALDIIKHRMTLVTHRILKSEIRVDRPTIHKIQVKLKNGDEYTLTNIKAEMVAYINNRLEHYKRHMKQFVQTYDACVDEHAQTLTTRPQRAALDQYRAQVRELRRGYDPSKTEIVQAVNRYENQVLRPSLSAATRKKFDEVVSVVKYVELTVRGEALGMLGRRRRDCATDLANTADLAALIDGAQKKTLIFSSYVDTIEAADARLRKNGYTTLMVYGKTNNDLARILDVFDKEPQANPLLATYKSLSTAVPMIAANVEILIDRPFRDYIYQQTLARVDRLGQDTPVVIYELTLDTGREGNISTRSDDIIAWSREQVDAILGTGDADTVNELVDGFLEQDNSMLTRMFNRKQKIIRA